jgi:hypothetical protein
MTDQGYRVHVYMTAVDKQRAAQLREALGRVLTRAGKEPLRDLMRRAHGGERILVYRTNDDRDALAIGQSLTNAGATIEIDGLRPPDDLF